MADGKSIWVELAGELLGTAGQALAAWGRGDTRRAQEIVGRLKVEDIDAEQDALDRAKFGPRP